MCELSVPHQQMSTQARQAQGIQKTEIKDINATTLWLYQTFSSTSSKSDSSEDD